MTDETDSPLASRFCPSPNHGERKAGRAIDCIVLHYTGMPTSEAALARLRDEAAQVSCHYFVEEDGTILQLVPEDRRAWHAGLSTWKGESDLNSTSIGVEIVNPGHDGGLPPFPRAQIDAVIALCQDIRARRAIPPERVLAHSDIAPGRKIDPGENFPWDILFEHGLGSWVPPTPLVDGEPLKPGDSGPRVAALRADLARHGYGLGPGEDYDEATKTVVAAFQRRFRPARVDGLADASTLDTLRRLVERPAIPPPPRSPPDRS